MRVDELMTREVVTVIPEMPLEAVAALLVARRISGVPVCDPDGTVVGIVSERDILYKTLGREERGGGPLAWFAVGPVSAAVRANARTAGETMSSPALTIEPSRRAAAAARLMIDRDVDRLPVVEADGTLVGIVTRTDLVRAFASDPDGIPQVTDPTVLAAYSR
ncbi:MAG TPA: CBS domain-containing protein [Gaiellaceae bacterium]|jgi:CBS domain-containing protein|nr:CBS domain-containing protein [Gaiellaceae bacterium]